MKTTKLIAVMLIGMIAMQKLNAQDTLLLLSGSKLIVRITDETQSEIYYMNWNDSLGSTYKIEKSSLKRVSYQKGNMNNLQSDYKCWIYTDSSNVYSSLRGVIHSVEDSGIVFAASQSGNTFRVDDRQLKYLQANEIEKIKIRRIGNVGKGMLIGGGVGFLVGGILGLSGATDYGVLHELEPGENALIGGTLFCIPGIMIGGIIGSLRVKIPINRNQQQYIRQKEKIRDYAVVN